MPEATPVGATNPPNADPGATLLDIVKKQDAEAGLDEELPPEELASEEPPVEEESEQPAADEGAPPEADAAGQLHTVMVDGAPVQVDLDELKRGYSREAAFTKRSQQLAEERRTFEGDRMAVQQERQKYGGLLERLETAVQMAAGPEPDWGALRQSDPAEYAARLAEHTQRQEQLRQIQAERAILAEQQQSEYQTALRAHIAQERQRLFESLPVLADPAKGSEMMKAMAQYGVSVGFRPEELAEVVDHRAVLVLHKAMLYDRLQQQRKTVQKHAQSVPVVKPGVPKPSVNQSQKQVVAARQRLKETGSVEDAAAFFLEGLRSERRR